MTLIEAAKKGAEWMRWWLHHNECDCDGAHSCGLNDRRVELLEIEAAIKAHESAEERHACGAYLKSTTDGVSDTCSLMAGHIGNCQK